MRTVPDPGSTAAGSAILARVLVGVDSSRESREAVRQVAELMNGEGRLELLAAYDVTPTTVAAGVTFVEFDEDYERVYREHAAGVLERARSVSRRADAVAEVVRGRPADALLETAARTGATLLVVGSHGRGRTAGIVLGSVATEVVHRAACSVLVARSQARPTGTVVVGLDGSAGSAVAYEVAVDLARRLGADVWPVVAHGGKAVDVGPVAALTSRREESPAHPVDALVAAAADADLLVVGSRGVHGLRALGSVSERVAHEAACSTLVVRSPRTAG